MNYYSYLLKEEEAKGIKNTDKIDAYRFLSDTIDEASPNPMSWHYMLSDIWDEL